MLFLISLGAGGISVIPFAFLQYTFQHGEGLITLSQIPHGALPAETEALFRILEAVMIFFALIHVLATLIIMNMARSWKKEDYEALRADPLQNAYLLVPFISIIMTMNVVIGPVRFFVPILAENLQAVMPCALAFWAVIWLWLMYEVIGLLRISFASSFDVSKISFSWLLHPMALAMLTVTGTGIAAMARSMDIANAAAFLSLVSGTMAAFLLVVKLIAIFKSHFAATGLPAKQFMPGLLIVVPNITLLAISAFRLGHYAERNLGEVPELYFSLVTTVAFAFETWYLMFGLALMGDYLRDHFPKNEFYPSQWGLICPIVAYAVLGSFVYSTFLQSPILYWSIIGVMAASIGVFLLLLFRQLSCAGVIRGEMACTARDKTGGVK